MVFSYGFCQIVLLVSMFSSTLYEHVPFCGSTSVYLPCANLAPLMYAAAHVCVSSMWITSLMVS